MTAIDNLTLLSSLSEFELFHWAERAQHLARLHGDVHAGVTAALREIADQRAKAGDA